MKLSIEALQLILLLMPGFIGAGMHSYLRHSALKPMGLIILAVLLGMLSALAVGALGILPADAGALPQDPDYAVQVAALVRNPYFYANVAAATVFGALSAVIYENRLVQQGLERVGLTRHYTIDDVWEQTFRDNNGRWLYIHLKDGRRLRGYARYYSMTGDARMLTLGEATLLLPDKKVGRIMKEVAPTDMRGDLLLLDMSEVCWIEFIEPDHLQTGR